MCYKQKCKVVSLNLAHPVYILINQEKNKSITSNATQLACVLPNVCHTD